LGFILYSFGTLLLSGAIVSSFLSFFILWNFFKIRIEKEEYFLYRFYGVRFIDYKIKVKSVFDLKTFVFENRKL